MSGRRLRICMVIGQFWPRVGGAERQALQQAQWLRSQGHEVLVVTTRHDPRWPTRAVVQGVPVERVGGVYLRGRLRLGKGLYWVFAANLLLTLLRLSRSVDVFHVHQLLTPAAIAALAGFLGSRPVVVKCGNAGVVGDIAALTCQAGWPRGYSPLPTLYVPTRYSPSRLVGLSLLALMKHTNVFVVATSSFMQREILAAGFDDQHVRRIPNGVDLKQFHPNGQRPLPWPGDKMVLCSARLSFEKGHDVLLRAWRSVVDQHIRARLVLAGDGPLTPYLHAMADELRLGDTVSFVGKTDEVAALLQQAYCAVSASRGEGMSNSVLEALASGAPVVATRVSGSDDLIVDGQNGLLVAPEDEWALAEALVRILRDERLAYGLAAQARPSVEDSYDIEAVTRAYLALYEQVLGGAPGASRYPVGRSASRASELEEG